ncbi:PREDICTED: protein CMSS1 isoform X2 [Nelumbo nucifera]|uniref:Protein CMSS1 isoform X2 n=1 Tax=Nelumbo nucifera TaxID=4432 RepID=A0A1U7YYS0_NELNU|nr:PREDICTED: protein CMSS1 isoform X2 [Nelumbo nucifera]
MHHFPPAVTNDAELRKYKLNGKGKKRHKYPKFQTLMGCEEPSKVSKQNWCKERGGGRNMKSAIKNQKNPNRIPLGPNRALMKKKKKNTESKTENDEKSNVLQPTTTTLLPSQQFGFFLDRLKSANNRLKLSSLEMESMADTCIVELLQDLEQNAGNLSKHMKAVFGKSWKNVLCEGQLLEGKVDPGSPAVLVISSSALRSLELLRGLRPLTRECQAAKLFAKHLKVNEQVSLLKARVNIASGTPNRIKKLIEIDALRLSRLAVLVLDMHIDAKGYSLFTQPQVSGEFWDLYTSHLHQQVIQGDLRICLYGHISQMQNEVKSAALDE